MENVRTAWIQKSTAGRAYIAENLRKINDRAAKIGSAGLVVRYTGKTAVDTVEVDGYQYKVTYEKLEIIGNPPKIAGWQFIARLEHAAGGNLIMSVPGVECPSRYATAESGCDHCHTLRIRKDTYVVYNADSGEYKQVGSSCIKDFLGHDLPTGFAGIFAELADPEERLCGGYSVEREYDTLRLLEITSAYTRKYGFLSRSKAEMEYRTATVDQIRTTYYCKETTESRKVKEEVGKPTEADTETAKKAIAWAAGLSDAEVDNNGYLTNLRTIARCETLPWNGMGLACSMLSAYSRTMEQAREAAKRPESQHVGQIGDRMDLTVTVHRVIVVEGNYGTTGIHKMTDQAGNELVWFATSGSWLEEGSSYVIKATVKAHDEYQGRKQTVVNRAKVVKEL